MTEDKEKSQSVTDSHTGDNKPKSVVDGQREEQIADESQNPPPDFEPQVELAPGQLPGIIERPGEQVSDIEEMESDQLESHADENDDEAIDDAEHGEPG